MKQQTHEFDRDDVLVGALAISQYLHGPDGTAAQVHRMRANSDFPFYKLKGKLHARKSSIRAWIERQEWGGKPPPFLAAELLKKIKNAA